MPEASKGINNSNRAIVPPTKIDAGWTTGRKWTVAGLVIGSLVTVLGIASMIALKTDVFSKIPDLKNIDPTHMQSLGLHVGHAGAALAVGGVLVVGGGLYFHFTKKEEIPTIMESEKRILDQLKPGEFIVYKNEYGNVSVALKEANGSVGDIMLYNDEDAAVKLNDLNKKYERINLEDLKARGVPQPMKRATLAVPKDREPLVLPSVDLSGPTLTDFNL